MTDRGLAPVVGVVLLLAIAIALAGVVGTLVLGIDLPAEPTGAAITAEIDRDSHRFEFRNDGGDAIDVSTLDVVIRVDGEPLAHQPEVPFVGRRGFNGSPSGPFNHDSANIWHPGERASFELACTNEPKPAPGTTVEIELAVNGSPVETITLRDQEGSQPS